jgi:hypothetical protein
MLDTVIAPAFLNNDQPYLGCDDPTSGSLQKAYNYDLTEYHNYPFNIHYKFNSRGFRDKEWPADVNNKVWCVGDSATCGTGVALEHMYSNLLKDAINCSKILADNEWIRDVALSILSNTKPKLVTIQWSFFHRNYLGPEKRGYLPGSYGEALRGQIFKIANPLIDQNKFDADYLYKTIMKVEKAKSSTHVIHMLTPSFHDAYGFLDRVEKSVENVVHIDWIDDARDKTFHYGVKSHAIIADRIIKMCHEKNIDIW